MNLPKKVFLCVYFQGTLRSVERYRQLYRNPYTEPPLMRLHQGLLVVLQSLTNFSRENERFVCADSATGQLRRTRCLDATTRAMQLYASLSQN